jgi:hypothetical protein
MSLFGRPEILNGFFRVSRKVCFLQLMLFIALAGVRQAHPQVDQGAVTGTVLDTTGAIVLGATVTLASLDTGLVLTRTTGEHGDYIFQPVKIGRYKLTASASGFETSTRENILVDVSSRVGVVFNLKPGSVSEVVEVTAAPELQTEEASTGQVFSTETISQTPLNGRNYVFIAQLSTGVAPANGSAPGSKKGDFTANGQRSWQNNYILDGVDNNSNLVDFVNGATFVMKPVPDALQEFKVQTSDYSAELGHSAGAVVNAAIKSGTNEFHGSAWEYFRTDKLNARDYFDTYKPEYHENQFGATLGGPIIRNKLFFFGDAEANRITFGQSGYYTVPSTKMREGDFSELLSSSFTGLSEPVYLYQAGGPQRANGSTIINTRYRECNGQINVLCAGDISTVAKNLLSYYPQPNVSTTTLTNNYLFQSKASDNTTQYDAKIDWNPTASDQAFARYSYSNEPGYYPSPLGNVLDGGGYGASGHIANQGRNFVFSETHFFNNNTSNEFRFGYNWIHSGYLQQNSGTDLAAQLGLGGIPFAALNGGLPDVSLGRVSAFGSPSYEPTNEKENVYQILDNISRVIGRHTLKAGVNIQSIRFYGLFPPYSLGSYSFTGAYTEDPNNTSFSGDGTADFLLDSINSSTITNMQSFYDNRWYRTAYVQDDWKLLRNLTINLGLRYEFVQPPHELNDRQANFLGDFNGKTGTYLLPKSQQNVAIPAALQQAFTADNISLEYTSNGALVTSQKMNFAPRIGFSYQIDDKSVVRGGFGIFYGGLESIGGGPNLGSNAPFNYQDNFPSSGVCSVDATTGVADCPTNGQTLETGFSNAIAAGLSNYANIPTIFAAQFHQQTPYSEAYNLSFERQLGASTTAQLAYVGNVDRHLQVSYNANEIGIVPPGYALQANLPFPSFGTIEPIVDQGVSNYNSFQAKLDRRYTNNLYFLASYTWAHSLDDAFGTIGQSKSGGYRNARLLGLGYDYGTSMQDVRQRFTLSAQYNLPFGKGQKFANSNKLEDLVIGGWSTTMLFRVQTGQPVVITAGNSPTNGSGGAYAIRVGDPFAAGGTPQAGTGEVCATKTRTVKNWFNPCAFANPPQAVTTVTGVNQVQIESAGLLPYGSKGRTSVSGPGYNRIDLSAFKSFPVVKTTSLQLRADIFNLLNTPAYGLPNNSVGSGSFSTITSEQFSGEQPDARVVQFAARFQF